jgi:DNA-binding NarL/FixJ family response regulator
VFRQAVLRTASDPTALHIRQHAYRHLANIAVGKSQRLLSSALRGSMSTVLVVDDFEPFRRLVCLILQNKRDLQVIGEASDGLEAVEKVQALKPDLILLDIGLPSLNGIEAAHRISCLNPTATILFVSQISDADVVQEALSNGAKGYVWKQDAGRDLLLAVEAALRGAHFISSRIKENNSGQPEEG